MTPAERARLRTLREFSGLSYSDVAARAGLQPMQVFNVLAGNNDNPKVETLRKVVEAMGGTLGQLFAGEEPDRSGPG